MKELAHLASVGEDPLTAREMLFNSSREESPTNLDNKNFLEKLPSENQDFVNLQSMPSVAEENPSKFALLIIILSEVG